MRVFNMAYACAYAPGAGVTVEDTFEKLRPVMLYAGEVGCEGLTIFEYAPGPGRSAAPVSSVLPNFSRARIVYEGTVFSVDSADVPKGRVE